MKAVIKDIDISSNIAFEEFMPDDPSCFGLWVTLHIGPEGEDGAHLYRAFICSPEWLLQEIIRKGYIIGRNTFIVNCYEPTMISRHLDHFVEKFEGSDYWLVAQKLSKYMAWEYEGYET